jgi:proprotein convertase subtilisin/kexin type 5
VCSCPAGKFFDGTNSCVDCEVECAVCTGLAACTQCKDTTTGFMTASSGVCSCVTGYYFNTSTNLCTACGQGCASCDSATSCTCMANATHQTGTCDCNSEFYWEGSFCETCGMSGCLECTNSITCT